MEVDMILAGIWSILPPVIAIVLALITKEVFSSLLVGILSGTVIYACFAEAPFYTAFTNIPKLMAAQISDNGTMLLFLALLGALVVVVTMAGGSRAYGNWARRKIRSGTASKLLSMLLGIIIFIDDYFNCLTVGTVMRPVTDKFGVSREKLAYIIDSTAAPVCIIAPISSWAAAVASNLDAENGFTMFLNAIPFNLYALLTITMVLVMCTKNLDFGPMRKAELEARARFEESGADESEEMDADFDGIQISQKGKVIDLILPILTLVVFSIVGMAFVGGFFEGKEDFISAIGESPTDGLCIGALAALIVAFIMYIPRKLVTFRNFMGGVQQGVKSMVPAIMILTFAWSLSHVCRDWIGTPEFVSGIVKSIAEGGGGSFLIRLLPAIIFLIAAFLSFSTGTAWGTFGILLPIVTAIFDGPNADMLIAAMGATLAGSVFGDHCSPISDTTILSSTGAKCDHIRHVSTQIPYAVFVAIICFIGYVAYGLTTGVTTGPWLMLLVAFGIFAAALAVIHFMYKKEKVSAGK